MIVVRRVLGIAVAAALIVSVVFQVMKVLVTRPLTESLTSGPVAPLQWLPDGDVAPAFTPSELDEMSRLDEMLLAVLVGVWLLVVVRYVVREVRSLRDGRTSTDGYGAATIKTDDQARGVTP